MVGQRCLTTSLLCMLCMPCLPAWANGMPLNEPILPIPPTHRQEPDKAALGDRLFHDARLSVDDSVSCAHCHRLNEGGADGLARSMGVGLAVDDFATGYSSLSYLKRFPMDILKINRSFVCDLPTKPEDMTLVKAIIAMARSLGLTVLAEGVETAEQLEFLSSEGCQLVQGYYYSRPVWSDRIPELAAGPLPLQIEPGASPADASASG